MISHSVFDLFGLVVSLIFSVLTTYWGFFIYTTNSIKEEIIPNVIKIPIHEMLHKSLWQFLLLLAITLVVDICFALVFVKKASSIDWSFWSSMGIVNILIFVILFVQFRVIMSKDWLSVFYNNTMKNRGEDVVARQVFEKEFKVIVKQLLGDSAANSSNCLEAVANKSLELYLNGTIESSDVAMVDDACRTIIFLKNHQHCCKVDAKLNNGIVALSNRLS